MEYHDYYKTLGVARDANEQEIKKAYRQLARQYHPDVNPGNKSAESRFKEINEAYQVLSDPEKRARYDQLGSAYHRWQSGGNSSGFDWTQWAQSASSGSWNSDASRQRRVRVEEFDGNSGGVFSDFFNSIFGNEAPPRGRTTTSTKPPIRGSDVEVTLTISLEEACTGTTREIKRGMRRLEAKIPPGAYEGLKIKLANQGEQGFAGGEHGDLYVIVSIEPHSIYELKNQYDLYVDVKVPLYTAVLGGSVRVPTLQAGEVKLKIFPGTQSGQRIRLTGKGMPKLKERGEQGDLYVRILVQVPNDLTDEERQLFEQLRDLRPES
jgi:curved DNA-binding protein